MSELQQKIDLAYTDLEAQKKVVHEARDKISAEDYEHLCHLAERVAYVLPLCGNQITIDNQLKRIPKGLETAILKEHAKHGREFQKRQAEAGRQRWKERGEVLDIVTGLAGQKDMIGDYLPPRELWSEFWSMLDHLDLNPQEIGQGVEKRIDYDGGSITYEAFRKHIARNRPKSR